MIDPAPLLGNYLIFVQFGIGIFILSKKTKSIIWRSALGIILAWIVSKIFKDLLFFPRPFITHNSQLIGNYLLDGSFPSGHTALSAALSTVITKINPKLGILMWVTTFFVAWGRILLGVHTIFDVLGGAILGFLIVKLVDNYHSR